MINGKKILAIIPARAGSKRLPNKNIKELAGKPLIAWTIDAALGSEFIDKIVLSTDSQDIADISASFGLPCTHLRPSELAKDDSTTDSVLTYEIEALESENQFFDYIVLLQPTSPLRNSCDIDLALKEIDSKSKDALVSMSVCEHTPVFSNVLPDDLNLSNFITPDKIKRTQELPVYYRVNGSIYIFKRKYIGDLVSIYSEKSIAYISRTDSDVDIDTIKDFEYAEFILSRKKV